MVGMGWNWLVWLLDVNACRLDAYVHAYRLDAYLYAYPLGASNIQPLDLELPTYSPWTWSFESIYIPHRYPSLSLCLSVLLLSLFASVCCSGASVCCSGGHLAIAIHKYTCLLYVFHQNMSILQVSISMPVLSNVMHTCIFLTDTFLSLPQCLAKEGSFLSLSISVHVFCRSLPMNRRLHYKSMNIRLFLQLFVSSLLHVSVSMPILSFPMCRYRPPWGIDQLHLLPSLTAPRYFYRYTYLSFVCLVSSLQPFFTVLCQ